MEVQIFNNSNNNNPEYTNPTDAGADIRADFSRVSPENPIKLYGGGELIFAGESHKKTLLRLEPGTRAIIPTGIYTAIPEGYEVQLRPRSGLAIKKGLSLVNTPGTIDCSYKNEWGCPVINLGHDSVWIEDGERICQAVLNKIEHIDWMNVKSITDLSGSDRGGGFGHSGSK
jgi:dUTP pyrophosphatase